MIQYLILGFCELLWVIKYFAWTTPNNVLQQNGFGFLVTAEFVWSFILGLVFAVYVYKTRKKYQNKALKERGITDKELVDAILSVLIDGTDNGDDSDFESTALFGKKKKKKKDQMDQFIKCLTCEMFSNNGLCCPTAKKHCVNKGCSCSNDSKCGDLDTGDVN